MNTQIWAHRGSSKAAPENTLAAFDLAVRQGADGIELDVHLTADGIVVVTHDESCLRATGAAGQVGAMTLQQLRQLDFAALMPGFTRQSLPTLAEVFDLIQPSNLIINIELKNGVWPYPGLEEQVLALAVEHRMHERICLSSFNHYSLVLARNLAEARGLHVPCGILYSCGLVEPWRYAIQIGAAAIHPHYANLRIPGLVSDCRQAGVAINAWTIDQPEHLRLALGLGIDAIITNEPDRALAIRGQLSGQA
jgi:glycerophosphoryl diester phosphodiesterase